MANKPFEIQSSTLTIGGVDLQAGTTSVVIPGVTQASNYFVEEVEKTGNQTSNSFPPDTQGVVVVIDAVLYNAIVAQGSEVGYASYIVTTDDDGYIDEIEVDNQGIYTQQQATTASSQNMYAYIGEGSASDRPLVPLDWTQIDFRPTMRAGDIESIGGGGSVDGLTGNTEFTPEAEGDTKYLLNINNDIELKTYRTGTGDNDLGPGFSLGDDNGSDRNNGVVAIGNNDVGFNAKQGGVYIGAEAGWNDSEGPQGEFAIAIGAYAARNFAEDNTITLNATGQHLDPTQTNSLFIKPVREDVTNTAKAMYYNTTTGEVTYTDPTGGSQDNNVWIQTFVSDSPNNDYPYVVSSVEYDAEGNIVALLQHFVDNNPNPNSDYFTVAKFDSAGTQLWATRFTSSQFTNGWGLTVDSVNSYVYVAGENEGTDAPALYQTSTLTKINAVNGAVVWTKDYDFGNHSYSMVVDVGSDGHPVLVGYAEAVSGSNGNRIITVKANSSDGSIIWSNSQDGQGNDDAFGMAVGPADEVVVVGYTSQLGIENTASSVYCEPASNPNWVTGTGIFAGGLTVAVNFVDGTANFFNLSDPTGGRTVGETITTIPGTSFGGTSPADDMVLKVGAVTSDLDDRILVTKFNSVGAIAWQNAVQFDAGFDCAGADADIDLDGNVYVCGSYQREYNGGTTSAMHLMKFDSSGVKQWSRRVVGDCQDFATSIVYGPDNHLYLSGVTGTNSNSDYTFVIAKYTPSGTVVWQRLLDNTTTWTFGAGWFSAGGGSNLDVKNGYVVVSGSKGDPGQQSYGFIAQISAAGEFFSTGDWDFKGASFSGLLNATASDVTVVAAGKTIEDISESITVTTDSPTTETGTFLTGTVLRPGVALGDLTVVGNMLIGTGDAYGGNGLNLAPGPGLAADMYFRVHGGDNPTHLHLSVGDTATYDQYFGTDGKYLKLGLDNTISIGTNGNDWSFGTNGNLALPGALVNSTTAKTGSSGLPGSGQVATVTLSSTNNTNFTPGVYPGLGIGVGSGYTLTLTVAGNGDLSVEVTASGTGFFIGEQANLLGAAIAGGSSPADDIVLTVATLNNVVVATALDLTKSVNKLTTGYYTLADGAEGQIMYLVRQDGSAHDAITVNVANGRINGAVYTTVDYFPFNNGGSPALNMSILIFTDGAWQADNGSWD